MPVTPARAADFARALAIVRPESRRRLYWTMRSVLVTDPAEVRIFDRAFREVFGDGRPDEAFEPDEQHTTAAEDEQRAPTSSTNAGEGGAQEQGRWQGVRAADGDDDGAPVEMPVALASDEERLAGRSFDRLEPYELAQLYDLMSRLRLATPQRRSRRVERARHGRRIDLRRTLRTSLRTGGEPMRWHAGAALGAAAAGDAVRHLRLDGAVTRAYLQFLTCAAAPGRTRRRSCSQRG